MVNVILAVLLLAAFGYAYRLFRQRQARELERKRRREEEYFDYIRQVQAKSGDASGSEPDPREFEQLGEESRWGDEGKAAPADGLPFLTTRSPENTPRPSESSHGDMIAWANNAPEHWPPVVSKRPPSRRGGHGFAMTDEPWCARGTVKVKRLIRRRTRAA